MEAELSLAAGLRLDTYRHDHVAERVRRALERERLPDSKALVGLLRRDHGVRARFRRAMTVPATGLFRDAEQFELLEHELLPPMLAQEGRLRIWSAGCATGEELMSLGLLVDRLGALDRAHLLGSDVLSEHVDAARRPRPDVPVHIRTALRWERRDLVNDAAPPAAWSLILCRNVAIYLSPEAKEILHRRLAGALRRGGVLLLGRAERLSRPAALGLEQVGPHAYRRPAR